MTAANAGKIVPMKTSGQENTKLLLQDYGRMCLLRRFEEKAASLYQQGNIGGFCHLYIGQEAVITGTKAALNHDDDIITSYRCHAHAIACDITPEAVMAELTGREGGISRGKGGSMHMFEPDKHFWGGHGIVAAQVPLGAGLAFASKYRGEQRLCATFIGDGAMNGGQVFETFNMAALWKLPVLFIIENNRYGMGTSVPRAAAGEGLYKRGEPFGIPGRQVDGMDYFAVRDAVADAAQSIRAGNGPVLLEMMTYRYRGHSMSDPAKYRQRSEVDEIRDKQDPINQMGKRLTNDFSVKEAELKAQDDAAKEQANKAAEFALASPEPALSEVYTDIIPT